MTLRTSSATVAVGDTDRGPLPCRVRAHRSCNRQHHRHDEEPYGSASRRTRPEEETTVRADTRSGGAMGTKYIMIWFVVVHTGCKPKLRSPFSPPEATCGLPHICCGISKPSLATGETTARELGPVGH